jgi:glutaredoxin-related protein
MKKLTAFEWYIEQHNLLVEECDNMPFDERLKRFLRLVDQAKEMEKEQRMSDFIMGITNANRMEATKDAETWYNETYGGNK